MVKGFYKKIMLFIVLGVGLVRETECSAPDAPKNPMNSMINGINFALKGAPRAPQGVMSPASGGAVPVKPAQVIVVPQNNAAEKITNVAPNFMRKFVVGSIFMTALFGAQYCLWSSFITPCEVDAHPRTKNFLIFSKWALSVAGTVAVALVCGPTFIKYGQWMFNSFDPVVCSNCSSTSWNDPNSPSK